MSIYLISYFMTDLVLFQQEIHNNFQQTGRHCLNYLCIQDGQINIQNIVNISYVSDTLKYF